MIRNATIHRTSSLNPAWMIELAGRAQSFIERETSMDICPNGALQHVCDKISRNPVVLVNGDMMMRNYDWYSDLERRSINLEHLGVSREELRRLIHVVDLELEHCDGIARAYGVRFWNVLTGEVEPTFKRIL